VQAVQRRQMRFQRRQTPGPLGPFLCLETCLFEMVK
jgi:hypothetical protein